MDVQKISGHSAASASPTPRPARDAAESGARSAEAVQDRIAKIEQALSAHFPADVKLQLDIDRNTGTVVSVLTASAGLLVAVFTR